MLEQTPAAGTSSLVNDTGYGDPLLEAILSSGVVLPTPSRSLIQLQAALADENAGPRQLAEILRKDPPLTGTLMRVANSPVFRPRTAARSVLDAVTMLGRTKTLAVAVNAALRGQSDGTDPRAVGAVWTRSAQVADWSFRAAQLCGRMDLADMAYLTALVHDVGIPVLLRRFPEQTERFLAPIGGIDGAALAMDAATGSDHSAVGALVAHNWKLPAPVAAAIRGHHTPTAIKHHGPQSLGLALLVAFARRILDGSSEEWEGWQPIAESQLHIDAGMTETLTNLRHR
jgi:HD-like signal output (HDOD) protein